jgi:hypothetical protein
VRKVVTEFVVGRARGSKYRIWNRSAPVTPSSTAMIDWKNWTGI